MAEQNHVINPQRLRRLLRQLIDIYSPSGKEEDVLAYLHSYLQKNGLSAIRQSVDDSRYNLIVIPPDTDVSVALIGHLDTVVAYDLENYGYKEEDNLVSGLGAADMKSGCAAMIEAYLSLRETGHQQPPVALVMVVGEEEEGDGAKRLLEEYHFPWAIIAEPTDLYPCLSCYGYMEVQLSVKGKRVHASLASRDQNPIETMLGLLLHISHYMVNDRPEGIYNIRNLLSTQAGFAVPDWCEAWVDVHLPPHAPIGDISLELEEIVDRVQKESPQIDTNIRLATIEAGYELPEKGSVVEALQATYSRRSLAWKPHPFPSHSDANQLWASGIKPILLGPGQLEKAHAPEESISFQQVVDAAELYRDLLISLLKT
ncbi:MAG: M20/M25/M40 family metallo-hydrolase [Syntrophobacterales bacterium]|jgi:acetylornithine deacetylase